MKRLGAVLMLATLSGCFLFRNDLPDDSCESDQDCFRAQGEVCDVEAGQCIVADGPDAGASELVIGNDGPDAVEGSQ